MTVPVVLPQLGENVTEGTVTRWLKREGDYVNIDEPLLEISTDKVDTEVLSSVEGTIASILIAEEKVAAVGETLALIEPWGTSAPETAPEAVPAVPAVPSVPDAPSPTPALPREPSSSSGPTGIDREFITPLVRKIASDHGVDLAAVSGTGAGGRIRAQDVRDAARQENTQLAPTIEAPLAVPVPGPAPTPTPTPTSTPANPAVSGTRGRTEPLSRLRKVIASRMVESLQVSAQLTSTLEADLSGVVALRQRAKAEFAAREGVGLSILPFVALAAIEALRVHPMVNASIDVGAGTATFHDQINLGIAVDTDRGLLAPVIHDAGSLNVVGLAHRIADLAGRARSNKLSADELAGGTFTITNTGSRGALFDTPILNQPQVGILGVGATVRRPVVVALPTGDEAIAIRSMVFLSLTYDHRLVDGADAARYLTTVKQRLETGQFAADLVPPSHPTS